MVTHIGKSRRHALDCPTMGAAPPYIMSYVKRLLRKNRINQCDKHELYQNTWTCHLCRISVSDVILITICFLVLYLQSMIRHFFNVHAMIQPHFWGPVIGGRPSIVVYIASKDTTFGRNLGMNRLSSSHTNTYCEKM